MSLYYYFINIVNIPFFFFISSPKLHNPPFKSKDYLESYILIVSLSFHHPCFLLVLSLLSSSSPSSLAPAIRPIWSLPPPHPPLPLSFSVWTFGREGGGRCRPVLYIRCQASDRDSGLWVNTLTASTEDILSVKWSLHYSRWKETERQRSRESHLFTMSPVLPCKGLHLFEIWGQRVKNATTCS